MVCSTSLKCSPKGGYSGGAGRTQFGRCASHVSGAESDEGHQRSHSRRDPRRCLREASPAMRGFVRQGRGALVLCASARNAPPGPESGKIFWSIPNLHRRRSSAANQGLPGWLHYIWQFSLENICVGVTPIRLACRPCVGFLFFFLPLALCLGTRRPLPGRLPRSLAWYPHR